MNQFKCSLLVVLLSLVAFSVRGFSIPKPKVSLPTNADVRQSVRLLASPETDETRTKAEGSGVVELTDDEDGESLIKNEDGVTPSGPLFISQGELDPEALNPDFSDAKQTRVLIYIILSLLPVLFLIPFMLSREFIPQDMMPPVDM